MEDELLSLRCFFSSSSSTSSSSSSSTFFSGYLTRSALLADLRTFLSSFYHIFCSLLSSISCLSISCWTKKLSTPGHFWHLSRNKPRFRPILSGNLTTLTFLIIDGLLRVSPLDLLSSPCLDPLIGCSISWSRRRLFFLLGDGNSSKDLTRSDCWLLTELLAGPYLNEESNANEESETLWDSLFFPCIMFAY